MRNEPHLHPEWTFSSSLSLPIWQFSFPSSSIRASIRTHPIKNSDDREDGRSKINLKLIIAPPWVLRRFQIREDLPDAWCSRSTEEGKWSNCVLEISHKAWATQSKGWFTLIVCSYEVKVVELKRLTRILCRIRMGQTHSMMHELLFECPVKMAEVGLAHEMITRITLGTDRDLMRRYSSICDQDSSSKYWTKIFMNRCEK